MLRSQSQKYTSIWIYRNDVDKEVMPNLSKVSSSIIDTISTMVSVSVMVCRYESNRSDAVASSDATLSSAHAILVQIVRMKPLS